MRPHAESAVLGRLRCGLEARPEAADPAGVPTPCAPHAHPMRTPCGLGRAFSVCLSVTLCPPYAHPPCPPCPPRRDPNVALASNVVIALVVSALAFGGLFPDQVASLWGLPPK